MTNPDEFGVIRSPEVAVFELITISHNKENFDSFSEIREKTMNHITYETLSKSIDISFDLDAVSTRWRIDGKRGYFVKHEALETANEIQNEYPPAFRFYETVNIHLNMLGEPIDIDNDPMNEPIDFLTIDD